MNVISDRVDPTTGEVVAKRVRLDGFGQGKTQQEFKSDVDINELMRRVRARQAVPLTPAGPGLFGQFALPQDFTAALDAINDAQRRFMELPAAARKAAGNSPAGLMEAMQDPDRLAELVAAGLPDEIVQLAPVQPTPPPPPDPPPPPAPVSGDA